MEPIDRATSEQPLKREASLARIAERAEPWDIAVIGGGSTGMGIAVDAASRGYSVVLVEQHDFGKGTSSRSTKLVHGGVRYLQQGNISLVMEALQERGRLLRNAPHIVHDLEFIVPNYQWWEAPFYGIGMKVYDLLAGKYGFGPSQILSREEVLERIPTLSQEGLRGGVKYHDGQFDDARLLIDLASTAAQQGACLVNYARVVSLAKNSDGFINGFGFRDEESSASYALAARCVINATGPFCDDLRRVDEPASKPIIAPSQGVHVVLPREFLPGDTAIMVPHTRDGRVMFAIPWHGHTLIGTTDTPIPETMLEPDATSQEIDFIFETASDYLAKRPTRADVLSVFTGIRPLVKADEESGTAALSRDHTIQISASGMLTIAGGKWTTYRHMAQDAVDHAMVLGGLVERECVTYKLSIHNPGSHDDDAGWFARHEMARTVEDVLARRTRLLFLDTRAALAKAPEVARELAQELGRDEAWQQSQLSAFSETASHFRLPS
jgi:glycerol-3-phosphate dehydrogenase